MFAFESLFQVPIFQSAVLRVSRREPLPTHVMKLVNPTQGHRQIIKDFQTELTVCVPIPCCKVSVNALLR